MVSTFMSSLGPLLLLGLSLRACGRPGTKLPSRGLGVPPWIRIGVASGLVLVLVILILLAVSASLALVLAFPMAFRLAFARVVLVLGTAVARALARILALSFADRRCLW